MDRRSRSSAPLHQPPARDVGDRPAVMRWRPGPRRGRRHGSGQAEQRHRGHPSRSNRRDSQAPRRSARCQAWPTWSRRTRAQGRDRRRRSRCRPRWRRSRSRPSARRERGRRKDERAERSRAGKDEDEISSFHIGLQQDASARCGRMAKRSPPARRISIRAGGSWTRLAIPKYASNTSAIEIRPRWP